MNLAAADALTIPILDQLGLEQVERGEIMLEAGPHGGRPPRGHGMPEPHVQLGGHRRPPEREEAVRHGAVEGGGDDAAVQPAIVAFQGAVAVELGPDAASLLPRVSQPQPARVAFTADQGKVSPVAAPVDLTPVIDGALV
jgi:hypothetical protein